MKMRSTKVSLLIVSTIATIGLATPQWIVAQQEKVPQEKPNQEQTFKGKVEAVDPSAKTLTVGGQLIYLTDATKISKDGRAIMLTDVRVDDQVHGTSRLTFDGKTEAITVMVGPSYKDRGKEKELR